MGLHCLQTFLLCHTYFCNSDTICAARPASCTVCVSVCNVFLFSFGCILWNSKLPADNVILKYLVLNSVYIFCIQISSHMSNCSITIFCLPVKWPGQECVSNPRMLIQVPGHSKPLIMCPTSGLGRVHTFYDQLWVHDIQGWNPQQLFHCQDPCFPLACKHGWEIPKLPLECQHAQMGVLKFYAQVLK